ncbi:hypothetical protein Dimus_027162 [Dionaea muscipula]
MAANTAAVPCWRNRRNSRGGGGDRQRNRRSKVEKSKKSEEEDSNRTCDPNGWCVGAPATDRRSPGAIIGVVAHLSSFASEQKERSERQGFALPLLGDVTGADRPSSVLPGRHRPMPLCFGCERSYLFKVGGKVEKRPQHMMRVAMGSTQMILT